MQRAPAIVIGAGPAGCAASVQLARQGFEPVLLDKTGRAGGLVRCGFLIENYPGFEHPLSGERFARRLAAHVAHNGVQVRRAYVQAVSSAPEGGWRVEADGVTWLTDALLLCTGTVPKQLALVGQETLDEQAVFGHLDELRAACSPSGRVFAIIGGGESGFDYALSLARDGAEVHILVRGQAPRARGRLAEMIARHPNIHLHLETRVESIGPAHAAAPTAAESPASGSLCLALCTKGVTSELRSDGVLTAIGRCSTLPRLLGGSGAARPSASGHPELGPGLFACGDARRGTLGQAGIAVGDGLAAAAAATEWLLKVRQ